MFFPVERRASVKCLFHFSFFNLLTFGSTPWTGDQPVTRPLPTYRATQTQNKHTRQTSMSEAGFEPVIIPSKRAKTVHDLDLLATMTGFT
jgi:hypothetical protein